LLTLATAAVFVLAGCNDDPNMGYTMADQYRSGISSVHVPMWDRGRDVYRRDLEFRLTEAVVKEIQTSTKYRIAEKADADTMLSGEVVLVTQTVMAFNPDTGNPYEQEIMLTIAFRWQDLRTGEILAEEKNLQISSTYIQDFNEDFFQGSQDVIDRAARRIVEHMEAPW
jgi:hypothetical protein